MIKHQSKAKWVILLIVLMVAGGLIFISFQKPKKILQTQLINQETRDEDEVLHKLASEIADGWNIPDLTYTVTITNKVNDYARVVITPTNQTLDLLQIIYKKVNGDWEYVDMGTTFPELESQMPELFRE